MSAEPDSSSNTTVAGSPGARGDEPKPGSLASVLWKILVALAVLGFFALVIWLAGRGRALTGSVADADTGMPIAGAAVAGPNVRTLTDNAGRFTLRIQGQPGFITIVADDYESWRVPWAQASAGGTLDVSLVPTPKRVIAGWLDDWQGRNYGKMFEHLDRASQADVSRNEFAHRLGMLHLLRSRVMRSRPDQDRAEVVAELEVRTEGSDHSEVRIHTYTLVREGGAWRVAWVPEPPPDPEPEPEPAFEPPAAPEP